MSAYLNFSTRLVLSIIKLVAIEIISILINFPRWNMHSLISNLKKAWINYYVPDHVSKFMFFCIALSEGFRARVDN